MLPVYLYWGRDQALTWNFPQNTRSSRCKNEEKDNRGSTPGSKSRRPKSTFRFLGYRSFLLWDYMINDQYSWTAKNRKNLTDHRRYEGDEHNRRCPARNQRARI